MKYSKYCCFIMIVARVIKKNALLLSLFLRYDFPQYGSRRRLISPMYDEYGEVIMEDDGYYYSPHGQEVLQILQYETYKYSDSTKKVS